MIFFQNKTNPISKIWFFLKTKLIWIFIFDFFQNKIDLYFQIWFFFQNKTDLYFQIWIFFKKKKLIWILKSNFFQNKTYLYFQIWFFSRINWSVFSNLIFLNPKLICIFIKYRSENSSFDTKLQILKFKRKELNVRLESLYI